MPFKLTRMENLFPTPLVILSLDDRGAIEPSLLQEIAGRRKEESSVERSNVGGWHSAPDFFRRSEPGHRVLAAELAKAVLGATRKLVPGADRTKLALTMDGWINVNPAGAYNAPHSHPGAFWSGVYYVQVPGADEVQATGGAIDLLNPRGSSADWPLLPSAMTGDRFSVQPTAGMLLLFPGHVQHWVHPYRGAGERISVAFNATFSRRTA